MQEMIRNDGEIFRLPRLRRKPRRRAILLLIDVSGSMKARTDAHLRFAHALVRAADRVEVFTIGTRLTRVTRALKLKNREQALGAASRPRLRLGRRHAHRRRPAGLPRPCPALPAPRAAPWC